MTQRITSETAVDSQVSGFDISRTASDTAATLVPLDSATGEKFLQPFMTHEPGRLAKLGPAMTGLFPASQGEA